MGLIYIYKLVLPALWAVAIYCCTPLLIGVGLGLAGSAKKTQLLWHSDARTQAKAVRWAGASCTLEIRGWRTWSGWRAHVTSADSANGLSKQTPAHLISADREPQPAYFDYSQRIQTMQMIAHPDDQCRWSADHYMSHSLASNFQTRERAKLANSSLDQVDTKMISEVFIKSDAKW